MRRVLLFVCMVWSSKMLFADCLEGTRSPTTAEKQFHMAISTALKSAMPPLPSGWKIVEQTKITELTQVCVGIEKEPMRLKYSMRIERIGGDIDSDPAVKAARQKALAALPQYTESLKVSGAKSEALDKQFAQQMEELNKKMMAAVSAQRFDEADRLRKELEALGKRMIAMPHAA